MRTLREIIKKHLRIITLIMSVVILFSICAMEIVNEQKRACDNAATAFLQIQQTLERNKEELREITTEYSQTCLYNAEAIAYLIQAEPSVSEDMEELKRIAALMEVDEIHIFDKTGRIVAGTHPEYYDYTFDSGEQMSFFKPMLEDRSLKLVQDVTPNTAEGKMMQYSALWSKDGDFILQVGMEPVRLTKVTEKNKLSYIFSMLRIDPAASYYAVHAESGEIVGSTDLVCVGKNLKDIGLQLEDIRDDGAGFHARVNGVGSYCVFGRIGANYIGRVMPDNVLYQRIPMDMAALAICLLLITGILSHAVMWCMNRYVVEGIHSVNEKLRTIAKGNLEESVDIQSSEEFSRLSSYINEMVDSLLANSKKMSYVLSKTNMYIGVYEYNEQMKSVRFTEHIPRILMLEKEESRQLAADSRLFQEFIRQLRSNPVPGEEGVFKLAVQTERYVKLEEICEHNEILGVVIDVTEETVRRRKIEVERDIDSLTGLYNRRGLDSRLERLFAMAENLGHYAVIMIDADGLKDINDNYGHDKGDIYLRKIADTINAFDPQNSVAARQGGDEFVLLIYGYGSQEELDEAVKVMEFIQRHCIAYLDDELRVKLEFSFGCVCAEGNRDYRELLRQADERMYENKRQRKKQRQ